MPTPAQATHLWQNSIKGRLEEAICLSVRATHDSEATLLLEFNMAGKSRKNLEPSIIITCCSRRKKAELKSILNALRWLKDSGLQHFIRVDRSFGHCAAESQTGAQPRYVIEARLTAHSSTLCGIMARIISSNSTCSEGPMVTFTIGGVICVNRNIYCLSAGHSFNTPSQREQTSIGPSDDPSSDEDESNSSLAIRVQTWMK